MKNGNSNSELLLLSRTLEKRNLVIWRGLGGSGWYRYTVSRFLSQCKNTSSPRPKNASHFLHGLPNPHALDYCWIHIFAKNKPRHLTRSWWERVDSDHRSQRQQIYSLFVPISESSIITTFSQIGLFSTQQSGFFETLYCHRILSKWFLFDFVRKYVRK